MNEEGDNSIIVVSGANATLVPEDIDANYHLLEECEVVILQLEIPLETVCYAAKLASRLGKTVILDTTAAGDSFTAALAFMLTQQKSLKESVKFANRVSSIVVTRKGAQSSIPSFQEVEEYCG